MTVLNYIPPTILSGRGYFGESYPLDRLKSLLILTGHGYIDCKGLQINLIDDYLSVPLKKSDRFRVSALVEKIPGCTNHQFRSLLRNASTKNVLIHKNIYNELVRCLAYYRQEAYLSSFVHLYRLVEHTALYLPLVTVASKGINEFTFRNYKEVIDIRAKADLSVLRKFSDAVLDQNFRDSVARYNFSHCYNSDKVAEVLSGLVGKDSYLHVKGPDFVEVKFKYTDMLIINFRNQFFHYLCHERNLSLIDLEDSEGFLKECMPNFISYFAFVYRELLVAEWELWAR